MLHTGFSRPAHHDRRVCALGWTRRREEACSTPRQSLASTHHTGPFLVLHSTPTNRDSAPRTGTRDASRSPCEAAPQSSGGGGASPGYRTPSRTAHMARHRGSPLPSCSLSRSISRATNPSDTPLWPCPVSFKPFGQQAARCSALNAASPRAAADMELKSAPAPAPVATAPPASFRVHAGRSSGLCRHTRSW